MAALKIQNHSKTNVQILSIGCSNESNLQSLSGTLSQCRIRIPELHPFVRVIPYRSILNLFIHGEIDVLVGFQDDIPIRDGVVYQELASVPICCAVPRDHPLARKKELSEAELLSENIILCNSYEIPTKAANIQNRLGNKFLPDSSYYCENLQVMLSLVKAGYGFAILPDRASMDPGLVFIPLAGYPPMSYGIFHKHASKNPLLKKFLSIVKPLNQES